MKKERIVLLLPAIGGGSIFPGEHTGVRNQNVKPRDLPLDLVAELIDRLELGEVDKTELDIFVAGGCLDIYSSR